MAKLQRALNTITKAKAELEATYHAEKKQLKVPNDDITKIVPNKTHRL